MDVISTIAGHGLYFSFLAFIFGAVIGSFLNVFLYRFHTSTSLGGHSHCLSCQKQLTWYELLPLLSYIAQLGKCRGCKSRIPSRYFVVELITGGAFVFVWQMFFPDFFSVFVHALIAVLLIVIVVYDIRHTIIPNEFIVALSVVALGILAREAFVSGGGILLDALYGALLGSLFFVALWLYSKGRWIGLGDAKLAIPFGLLTGFSGAFSFIIFSFWIGAAVSVTLLAFLALLKRGKQYLPFIDGPLTMKSEIPFAPFLVAGFIATYYFSYDVFSFTETLLF